MNQTPIPSLRFARLGEVSSATLRTVDLLNSFHSALEDCVTVNGAFLSMPENFPMRDRLAKLLGEAQDAFQDDGETLQNEETSAELVNETLPDALNEFAPPYAHFGSHEGDGACFGFWADIDGAKEDCGFVSLSAPFPRMVGEFDPQDCAYPVSDYRGEWLHVNDRGNCTLYVREDDAKAREGYTDREVWSVV